MRRGWGSRGHRGGGALDLGVAWRDGVQQDVALLSGEVGAVHALVAEQVIPGDEEPAVRHVQPGEHRQGGHRLAGQDHNRASRDPDGLVARYPVPQYERQQRHDGGCDDRGDAETHAEQTHVLYVSRS